MPRINCKSTLLSLIQCVVYLFGCGLPLHANLLIPDSLTGSLQQLDISTELLQDGAFKNGVANWQSAGTVPNVTGQVILWDSVYPSGIWQPVPVGEAYGLTLSFRIRYDLLSAVFDPGTFPDFFVASLEFASDPADFSIYGGGVDAITLATADALSGLRDPVEGLAVVPDASAPNWQLITFETQPLGQYVTPFIRLFDENMTAGDSRVIITDVSLVAHIVPEPGLIGIWLGLAGLGLALITRPKLKH